MRSEGLPNDGRLESVVPKMTKTRTKVRIISTPSPWPEVRLGFTSVTARLPWKASGVSLNTQTDRYINRYINRQAERQTYKEADKQTDRHT